MRRFGIGWMALVLLLALLPVGCTDQVEKAKQREAWEQYLDVSTAILKEAHNQMFQNVLGLTSIIGRPKEEQNAIMAQSTERFATTFAQALEHFKALKPPKGLEEVHQVHGETIWICAETSRLLVENDRQDGNSENRKRISQWSKDALNKSKVKLREAYRKAVQEWKKLDGGVDVEQKYFR